MLVYNKNLPSAADLEGQVRLLPEEALALRVLERAVMDLEHSQWHIRRDALSWLVANGTEPFSFLFICEHFGLEPERLREKLLEVLRGVPARWGKGRLTSVCLVSGL